MSQSFEKLLRFNLGGEFYDKSTAKLFLQSQSVISLFSTIALSLPEVSESYFLQ